MAPQNVGTSTLNEEELRQISETHKPELEERKLEIDLKDIYNNLKNLDYSKVVWRNVIIFVIIHIYSVYGLYLLLSLSCMWKTVAFSFFTGFLSGLGITMGAHRLWTHRSYKAKFPLRVILAYCQSLAFQNSIFEWARDHRVHHKYSETDADPHNAHRGFFFSHMGWLMYRKHPDVKEKGKNVDLSDLMTDPIVRFQKRFYVPIAVFCSIVLPTFIPWYCWGESFVCSLMVPTMLRYCLSLHFTWLVNSLAHWIGSKPFDKHIFPSQNTLVAILAFGEGWHNYHHVFPFDYRTAELGGITNHNLTALVIDFCAKMGWAYDLRTANPSIAMQRAKRTGDGSYKSPSEKQPLVIKDL